MKQVPIKPVCYQVFFYQMFNMATDSYDIATMIKLVPNPDGYNMSALHVELNRQPAALSILSLSSLRGVRHKSEKTSDLST